jgi:hypothetical protein
LEPTFSPLKRNFGEPRARFFHKVQKTDGCWLWKGKPASHGYGRFTAGYHTDYAHRWAWFFEHDEWPDLFVCHNCDNPICVNPEHLFLGTCKDNNFDMWLKERQGGRARVVSHAQRDEIRELISQGKSQRQIAEIFGCSQTTVSEINRNLHEYAR